MVSSQGCPDEEDWAELYEVLGDRQAQDVIRSMNPQGTHCPLLQMSPMACDGCEKNPYTGTKGKDEGLNPSLVEEYAGLINFGFESVLEMEMGVLKDPLELDPLQFEALKQARMITEELRDDRLAAKIVKGVAELFGGSEKRHG